MRSKLILLLIFGMPGLLALVYLIFLTGVALTSGFSWREMDWNGDGRTTLREALATADVLERPVQRGGRACVELFWARNGTRIRVECPG